MNFYMYFCCEQEIISFHLHRRLYPFLTNTALCGSQYPQIQGVVKNQSYRESWSYAVLYYENAKSIENLNLFKMLGVTSLGHLFFISLS